MDFGLKCLLLFPQIKVNEGRFISLLHEALPQQKLVGKRGCHVTTSGSCVCLVTTEQWSERQRLQAGLELTFRQCD